MTTQHEGIDASVHDANPIDTDRLAATWLRSTAGRDLLADIVDGSTSHAAVVEVPRRSRRTLLIAAAALTTAALLLAGWSARQASITAPANSERTEVFTRGLPDFGVNCALPAAGASQHPVQPWVDRVRSTLEDRCYTVNQAASKVRSLFAENEIEIGLIPLSGLDGTNIDAYEWSIGKHGDTDAECTRADINYWGPFLEVVLRGPKA
jgi:hypothetical protein